LEEELPLSVVREAWLASLDEPSLTQRFLAGRVNFCTLLPMRAIPFEVVCLMGMNDGDYPRSQLSYSFDLMSGAGGYRPGDRSRREDDRYLFLEALLSARRRLYLSWVGRSVQDNSERPPSLLVGQLRDYLAAGWQGETSPLTPPHEWRGDQGVGVKGVRFHTLLERLTVEHPLQPFGIRYFLPAGAEGHDPRLFSYAHEWRAAHGLAGGEHPSSVARKFGVNAELAPYFPETSLNLETVAGFLRHPVKAFFTERLKVRFEMDCSTAEDFEPFAFDALQKFNLGDELLRAALNATPESARSSFESRIQRLRLRGKLPMAGFAESALKSFADPAWEAYQCTAELYALWPEVPQAPHEIRLEFAMPDSQPLRIEDWLPGLRGNGREQWAQILVRPQEMRTKEGDLKWHTLIRPWVRHLAGCTVGLDLRTVQVGPDGPVTLPPIAPAMAHSHLQTLLDAWYCGMQSPLPLACKTAFAWLKASSDAEAAAAQEYEGGYGHDGEVEQDSYLKRAFPTFKQLWQAGGDIGFAYWAGRLYEPLWQTVQSPPEGTS
jgi:exodeoxyribonuclease V gamma subunit